MLTFFHIYIILWINDNIKAFSTLFIVCGKIATYNARGGFELEINEIIKKLRKDKDLTQSQLGEILSCDRTRIVDIERGKTEPKLEDIRILSKKYNVSADYLLGIDDIPTNDKDKQFVCNYTGLSLDAIEKLTTPHIDDENFSLDDIPSISVCDPITNLPLFKSFVNGDDISHLSLFIEDNNFFEFVRLLSDYSKNVFQMEM